MGNNHAVAALHLSAQDSLTGIFLRVEHNGRTFEMPQFLVNTGGFYHTAVLGDVSEENGKTAILGVSMLQVADTTVFAVFIQLAPLCILTSHLR